MVMYDACMYSYNTIHTLLLQATPQKKPHRYTHSERDSFSDIVMPKKIAYRQTILFLPK